MVVVPIEEGATGSSSKSFSHRGLSAAGNTHDDVDPGVPSFTNILPISPTNQTTQPQITGTSTADTEMVVFYDSNVCLNSIGSGTKAELEGAGATAGVVSNDTTNRLVTDT